MSSIYGKSTKKDRIELINQLEPVLSELDKLDLKLPAIHVAQAIEALTIKIHSSAKERDE